MRSVSEPSSDEAEVSGRPDIQIDALLHRACHMYTIIGHDLPARWGSVDGRQLVP